MFRAVFSHAHAHKNSPGESPATGKSPVASIVLITSPVLRAIGRVESTPTATDTPSRETAIRLSTTSEAKSDGML
jgi:hypothetical protein